MECDLRTALSNSTAFDALTPDELIRAMVYLQCVITSTSPDAPTLSSEAANFIYLADKRLLAAKAYNLSIEAGLQAEGADAILAMASGLASLPASRLWDIYKRLDCLVSGACGSGGGGGGGAGCRGSNTGGFGLFAFGDPGITGEVVITDITNSQGYDIENTTGITGLSWPNLTSIDPSNTSSGGVIIINDSGLTSFSMPLLTKVGSIFEIATCPNLVSIDLPLFQSITDTATTFAIVSTGLTSLSLPSFVSGSQAVDVRSNASLSTVSIPSFVPPNNTNVGFTINALNASSVNHILARCVANAGYVSGAVDLSGGTNAAPTGQGATDKATLIGRGVSVTTN